MPQTRRLPPTALHRRGSAPRRGASAPNRPPSPRPTLARPRGGSGAPVCTPARPRALPERGCVRTAMRHGRSEGIDGRARSHSGCCPPSRAATACRGGASSRALCLPLAPAPPWHAAGRQKRRIDLPMNVGEEQQEEARAEPPVHLHPRWSLLAPPLFRSTSAGARPQPRRRPRRPPACMASAWPGGRAGGASARPRASRGRPATPRCAPMSGRMRIPA
mmetsp:Transcript_44881/g.113723  ORF Transcript_44881/g.113723 Transcript_44881/m.113723 type:complete len:219 (+) Transcript_44881:246-902(+)